jgi:hypothetical protein
MTTTMGASRQWRGDRSPWPERCSALNANQVGGDDLLSPAGQAGGYGPQASGGIPPRWVCLFP